MIHCEQTFVEQCVSIGINKSCAFEDNITLPVIKCLGVAISYFLRNNIYSNALTKIVCVKRVITFLKLSIVISFYYGKEVQYFYVALISGKEVCNVVFMNH